VSGTGPPGAGWPRPFSPSPLTVRIVIPTLDEADQIGPTLASVARQEGPFEVVVVDGGSSDGTPEVAVREGHRLGLDVRVLSAARGRAQQMNAGAAAASGDVLLFLHADTRLPAGALAHVRRTLTDPAVVGGCFRTTFDLGGFWMRLWSLPLWMRWHRFAFGDRAPFVRRTAFEAVGGFPDQPLFEDLELVRRVRRLGRFAFLDAAVVTSARRFAQHGPLRQQLRNLVVWGAWNLRLPPRWFVPLYPYAPGARG